jgi:hypothetical protein
MILIKEEDLIGKYNRKVDVQIFGISSLILSFFMDIYVSLVIVFADFYKGILDYDFLTPIFW